MAKTLTEKFESERKECVTSEDFLRLINRWRNIQGENVAGVEYSRKQAMSEEMLVYIFGGI